MTDEELWLACDPGEDVGWSLWRGETLIEAGTAKLWEFGEAVFVALHRPEEAELIGDELAQKFIGICRIVAEDWRIYPWEAKKGALDWDPCRTARLIGGLTIAAKMAGIQFVLQPAKIKERAEAAGAEVFFLWPRKENRHANDAIRHGVYYIAVDKGVQAVSAMEFSDNPEDYEDPFDI